MPPTGAIKVIGGVFRDSPPGSPFENERQLRGATRYGLNLNLRTVHRWRCGVRSTSRPEVNSTPAPPSAGSMTPGCRSRTRTAAATRAYVGTTQFSTPSSTACDRNKWICGRLETALFSGRVWTSRRWQRLA